MAHRRPRSDTEATELIEELPPVSRQRFDALVIPESHMSAERVQVLARRETVKHLAGQRIDRCYKEVPVRAAWSDTRPTQYVEPTSRCMISGWIRTTEYQRTLGGNPAAAFPLVISDPAAMIPSRFGFLAYPGMKGAGTEELSDASKAALRLVMAHSQNSSYLATRHGLARIRDRGQSDVGGGRDFEVVPWGASVTYPSALTDFPAAAALRARYGLIHRPTPDIPWPWFSSGCLPLFYMDAPTPWAWPTPTVTHGVDRFGPSVYSKFRELKLVLEPFPYLNNLTTNKTLPEFFRYHLDPKPWARVIIFKQKRRAQLSSVHTQALFPPIFPNAAIGSSHNSERQTTFGDVTYDTPVHGHMAKNWPSDAPESPFVIIEDFVVNFKPVDLPRFGERHVQETLVEGGTEKVFANYGQIDPISVHAETRVDSHGFLRPVDADGIPHTWDKVVIKRVYNDNGREVSWHHTGLNAPMREGLPPTDDRVPITLMESTDTNPRVRAPDQSTDFVELDMCDEQMFITVISGCHITQRAAITPRPAHTVDEVNMYPGVQGTHIGVLDPANTCNPVMVSIETKWWYADQGITGPPRDIQLGGTAAGGTIRQSVTRTATTL